ncbi:MAG: sec-independent protein translocase protein TatA [Bacteroidales bacterium]|nr:sec-independent protein translocase protein TatA [Bacteroidales bacterium]
MYRMFLFISGQEIFIILLVVLLLFGANKIPEIARGLGKGMREFRKAADDIKREVNNHTDDIKKDMKDLDDNIKDINDGLKG